MTRADRYVLREFAGPFAAGLVLSVLLILVLQLQRATGGLVRGGASLVEIVRPLLYDIPRIVVMAMPVATALGTSLAVNRLARDREATVLRGTGKSLVRCFAPFLAMGVLLTGVNLWISEVGVPEARLRARSVGAETGVVLGPGALPDATARRLVSFAEARGDGRSTALERVVVVDDRGIAVSPRGRYGDRELVLEGGFDHGYDARGTTVRERGPAALRIPALLDFVPPTCTLPSD
ncbi:MAG: LptF/LptG family permease, partial [Armatimonadota bacterium]